MHSDDGDSQLSLGSRCKIAIALIDPFVSVNAVFNNYLGAR